MKITNRVPGWKVGVIIATGLVLTIVAVLNYGPVFPIYMLVAVGITAFVIGVSINPSVWRSLGSFIVFCVILIAVFWMLIQAG